MTSLEREPDRRFSGQLIPDGTRPYEHTPAVALETIPNETILANLDKIGGLTRKIGKIINNSPDMYVNPLDRLWKRIGVKYGVGAEIYSMGLGVNRKSDGTKCYPMGDVHVNSQIALTNFAYDITVDIKDREINTAVLSDEDAMDYISAKLAAPKRTIEIMRWAAQVRILEALHGITETDASNDASDGSGTDVSVARTAIAPSSTIDLGSVGTDLASVYPTIRAIIAAAINMRYPHTVNGQTTYTTKKPVLLIPSLFESLIFYFTSASNGQNNVIGNATGYELNNYVDIVSVPELGTDGKFRAILADPDAFIELDYYADVEAARCTNTRGTGYSFQGAGAFVVDKSRTVIALQGEYRGDAFEMPWTLRTGTDWTVDNDGNDLIVSDTETGFSTIAKDILIVGEDISGIKNSRTTIASVTIPAGTLFSSSAGLWIPIGDFRSFVIRSTEITGSNIQIRVNSIFNEPFPGLVQANFDISKGTSTAVSSGTTAYKVLLYYQ